MRILVVSPNYAQRYNRVFEDFRRTLADTADVSFWGRDYANGPETENLYKFASRTGPYDWVLVCHLKYHEKITADIQSIPSRKAAMVVDYLPRNRLHRDRILDLSGVDTVFVNQTHSLELLEQSKKSGTLSPSVQGVYLPFSIDPKIYPTNRPRTWDASAVFTTIPESIYHKREAVIRALERVRRRNVKAIRANNPQARITGNEYLELLGKSKAVVCTTSSCKCVTLRHFEAAAAGALVLTDWAPDLERLGFVDERTIVLYDGINDMIEKLMHYTDSENYLEWLHITQQARRYVRNNHSCSFRVGELLAYLAREG